MKVYVLTAVNSFGGDVYFASTHRTFEGAKEEMMLRFNESFEEYKEETYNTGIKKEVNGDSTIYLSDGIIIAEVFEDSAYLEYNECEDEYYYWRITETELKD